jgi:hypothetical protein
MNPLDATCDELKSAGIAFAIHRGKRHDKVRFNINQRSCLVVVSRSASDHRAGLNARLTVRRIIRKAME